jgi:phosphoglycerate dehydrogenase-like enzyme
MAKKIRVHFKSNRASAGSWPDSEEGERVFAFSKERFDEAAVDHPELALMIDPVFDWDRDNFDASMRSAEVLVTWDLPTVDLAKRAPRLRWIHIVGAGVEHLMPMSWLPKGVTLTNSKGVHAHKSGGYGLMALLMLNNAVPALIEAQHAAHYNPIYSTAIEGKSLLILGVGQIGGAVARHAKHMGMHVIGVRRSGRPSRHVDEMVTLDVLEAQLPRADFVLVSLPTTPETAGVLDARRLAMMKHGAGLINVARASLVDYDAMASMLRSGALSGAVLDVFDPEPLPRTSALWTVPNLIITPHVSSDEQGRYVPMVLELFFNNLAQLIEGRPLRNRVRPELGY